MVRQDFDQVLSRLSDADLPWAPADGMRTVGGQLFEIAGKEVEAVGWLRTGEWNEDPDVFRGNGTTIEGIKTALASIRANTFNYIDSLTEDELLEPMPCPERWWEALRLTECPKSEILRNIAAHEWYHTAQLVSNLWMRGDDPYSW